MQNAPKTRIASLLALGFASVASIATSLPESTVSNFDNSTEIRLTDMSPKTTLAISITVPRDSLSDTPRRHRTDLELTLSTLPFDAQEAKLEPELMASYFAMPQGERITAETQSATVTKLEQKLMFNDFAAMRCGEFSCIFEGELTVEKSGDGVVMLNVAVTHTISVDATQEEAAMLLPNTMDIAIKVDEK